MFYYWAACGEEQAKHMSDVVCPDKKTKWRTDQASRPP